MGTFDFGELDNRLSETNASLECLSCGSSDVHHADRKVGLVEVGLDGRVELYPQMGAARVIYCAARICNACGYVHLYSAAAIDRSLGQR
jgi:predicted nucleic-acid-binding Zn-ribbon protein